MTFTNFGAVDQTVEVVLSRRNLLSLLAKLDGYPTNSTCSLRGGDDADGLVVHAEEDAVHYAERPPGALHDATERALDAEWLVPRPTA